MIRRVMKKTSTRGRTEGRAFWGSVHLKAASPMVNRGKAAVRGLEAGRGSKRRKNKVTTGNGKGGERFLSGSKRLRGD